jgi:transcriptional regulator with XRE-family HTH domain
MQEFETRLQRALERAGLSQAELARRIEAHPNLVNSWVSGRRRPSLAYLAKLAPALEVGTDWLLLGGAAPPPLGQDDQVAERVRGLGSELIELVELARRSID